MKQPKKRWAWTTWQCNRTIYFSGKWRTHLLSVECIRLHWKTHRARTRQALHQVMCDPEESEAHFPYQHRRNDFWQWL